jgi:hypothetical protein
MLQVFALLHALPCIALPPRSQSCLTLHCTLQEISSEHGCCGSSGAGVGARTRWVIGNACRVKRCRRYQRQHMAAASCGTCVHSCFLLQEICATKSQTDWSRNHCRFFVYFSCRFRAHLTPASVCLFCNVISSSLEHYREVSLYLSVVGLSRWRRSSAAAPPCRAAGISAGLIPSRVQHSHCNRI